MPLKEKHSNRVSSLASTFAAFKKEALNLLIDLIHEDEQTKNNAAEFLAFHLDRTQQFILKTLDGVELLSTMPDLLKEVRSDATFDLDRLAGLGNLAKRFEFIDSAELEVILRDILSEDDACPSPSKITRRISTSTFENSILTKTEPKKSSKPDLISHDSSTETATLRFPCSSSQFALIQRLINEYSDDTKSSVAEAVLHLLRGGKRPRVTIMAFDIGEEELYVEGEGWVTRKEFEARDDYLSETKAMSSKELLNLLMNYPNSTD